jgi:hypothetical protein
VKLAIRMWPPGEGKTFLGGRLGWLKWREFGRRGDTARDQVIQAPPLAKVVGVLELKCALVVLPSQEFQSRSLATHSAPSKGGAGWRARKTSRIRPLIREDYPLSLSISLSGGEETNQDFPSNGERTGKSPA